jgi:hypothetical protein
MPLNVSRLIVYSCIIILKPSSLVVNRLAASGQALPRFQPHRRWSRPSSFSVLTGDTMLNL